MLLLLSSLVFYHTHRTYNLGGVVSSERQNICRIMLPATLNNAYFTFIFCIGSTAYVRVALMTHILLFLCSHCPAGSYTVPICCVGIWVVDCLKHNIMKNSRSIHLIFIWSIGFVIQFYFSLLSLIYILLKRESNSNFTSPTRSMRFLFKLFLFRMVYGLLSEQQWMGCKANPHQTCRIGQ